VSGRINRFLEHVFVDVFYGLLREFLQVTHPAIAFIQVGHVPETVSCFSPSSCFNIIIRFLLSKHERHM